MQLGDFQLSSISGGSFKLDGGAMFSVVPKPLWERYAPPDEQNRIASATRAVLVRTPDHLILIDAGYGSKLPDKQRAILGAEAGDPLAASLHRAGVQEEQITHVILSHLHFDHAGGSTRYAADGRLVPTFPNAQYIAQRGEWAIATAEFPELRGSYPLENLLPLRDSGQLTLIDGDVEILPGVDACVTGGHTQYHQAISINSGGQTAVFVGDICPMAAHLPVLWCMGYDVALLETRRVKARLLGKIAERGWLLLWDHDPHLAAARIRRDERRDFAVLEEFTEL